MVRLETDRGPVGGVGPAAFSTSDAEVSAQHGDSDVGGGTVEGIDRQDLGCCPATVDNVRKRYRSEGWRV